jgi:hypothetical protein
VDHDEPVRVEKRGRFDAVYNITAGDCLGTSLQLPGEISGTEQDALATLMKIALLTTQ